MIGSAATAPATLQITEALEDGFPSPDKSGQATDRFTVCLIVGNWFGQHHLGQKGEIGVVGFVVQIGVPVHANKACVVLQGNIASLVSAERSGLIVILGGLDKKSGIVDNLAQILHNVIVNLNPHPHFDSPLLEAESMLDRQASHPFGSHPPRGQDDIFGGIGCAFGYNTNNMPFLDQHIFHLFGSVYGYTPGF